MILTFILCVIFLVWLFTYLHRNLSVGAAILSPIFYFTCLWFLAFPLHAYFLHQGWVDTQQRVVLSQNNLIGSVWLSLFSILLVCLGALWKRPLHAAVQTSTANVDDSAKEGWLAIMIIVLMLLGGYFLTQTVFKAGSFIPFIGNEQNEARIGKGPLFFLSDLFVYGLIAAIPVVLELRRWSFTRVLFLLMFVAGLAFAVYMGIVTTSRRTIVLPLFALALAWLYQRRDINAALAIVLLASTVYAAPALQTLRYVLTPQPTIDLQPTPDFQPTPGLQSMPAPQLVPARYCRPIGHVTAPQKAVTILDPNGRERELSGLAAQVARKLCDVDNYGSYIFIQTVASSYGLADHLASYLRKATPVEMAIGIDQGVALAFNLFLAIIPRAVWDDKPLHYGSVAEQKWLYPHMYDIHQVTMTLPPSFIVDFLFGFGVPSLVILCFGLGRLLAWTHTSLLKGLRPDNRLRFVLGLFLMAYLFNVVRGGTGFVQSLVPMFAVLALMHGVRPLGQLFTRSSA